MGCTPDGRSGGRGAPAVERVRQPERRNAGPGELRSSAVYTLGLVDRKVGVSLFEQRTVDHGLLSFYSALANRVHDRLWPEEDRALTPLELIEYLLEHRATVVIVQQHFLNDRDSIQSRLLRSPGFKQHYRPSYRVNRLAHLYERRGFTRDQPLQIPANCEVEELVR